MSAMVQSGLYATRNRAGAALGKGLAAGIIGGLVGTFGMDLFGFAIFLVLETPAVDPFAIIGDTVTGVFAVMGVHMAGGTALGMVVHYLMGPALGAILGAAASRSDALRVRSTLKGVGLGVLYIEVVSQPFLVLTPIVLRMTASETVGWFGLSFVMHLVYGLVLGLAVSYGLRSAGAARQK